LGGRASCRAYCLKVASGKFVGWVQGNGLGKQASGGVDIAPPEQQVAIVAECFDVVWIGGEHDAKMIFG
jgi:hypothetical protein